MMRSYQSSPAATRTPEGPETFIGVSSSTVGCDPFVAASNPNVTLSGWVATACPKSSSLRACKIVGRSVASAAHGGGFARPCPAAGADTAAAGTARPSAMTAADCRALPLIALRLAFAHLHVHLRADPEPLARSGLLRDDAALLHPGREGLPHLPDRAVRPLDRRLGGRELLALHLRHDALLLRRWRRERGGAAPSCGWRRGWGAPAAGCGAAR